MVLSLTDRRILWLKDKLGINENPYAVRHIVNKQRTNLSRKLYELSEIFFQMQVAFQSMVKGTLPMDKAKIALSRDVSEKVCRDCLERQNCWRTHIESTETDFIAAVEAALHRGRATILDLTPALTSRCGRTTNLLNEINRSVSVYKQYYSITTNADAGRLLIGDQMGGVSQIFKSLSQTAGDKLQFNTEKEKEIMEELTYRGVLTKEGVFCVEGGKISLTLVVAATDIEEEKIVKLLSKLCRTGLSVREKEYAADRHWVVATLEPEANFSVSFGFCGRKKQGSESSGDTHSFLRIADDKVLVALCDGMGSGAAAEQASSTAISLVENFYKAGFDNDLILNSVNRLLSIENGETFTAVDICVLDLKNGAGDFIKIGAPYGVVKLADETELIQAGSLPLGVLEEMKPIITRKTLCHGDCVLLASDGFMDCFDDAADVAMLLHDRQILNPQETADELMQEALKKCDNVPKDDMTVVIARLS